MIDTLHDHFILCGYGRVGAAAEWQRAGVHAGDYLIAMGDGERLRNLERILAGAPA
ncbi:MAG: hypothetical protein ACRD44_07875 [Bryobacteraceae bacterium]